MLLHKVRTKQMGKFLDFIEKVSIVLTEPKDWKMERVGKVATYTGKFLVYDRVGKIKHRIQGRVVQKRHFQSDVYIYDPPVFVKTHHHGSCLQLLKPNDKWFKIHFEKPAKDFASAYTYVEHLLTEAYNSRGSQ